MPFRLFAIILALLTLPLTAPAQIMDQLPDGYIVHTSAPTYQALLAKAKPTLVFDSSDGQKTFMWTDKTPDGKRTFALASVAQYWPKGGKAEWIIAAAKKNSSYLATSFWPRTQVTIGAPKSSFNGNTAPASGRVLSIDPAQGTLYEIALYDSPCQCGATEWRVYFLHDPKHGWRYVGEIRGDSADDAAVRTTTVTVRWTGKPDAPIDLTVTWRDQSREDKAVPRYTRETYRGTLPLWKAGNTENFVKVERGDTLSTLLQQLVKEALPGEKDPQLKPIAKALRAEVERLNPQLKADRLALGQRIDLPDLDAFAPIARVRGY